MGFEELFCATGSYFVQLTRCFTENIYFLFTRYAFCADSLMVQSIQLSFNWGENDLNIVVKYLLYLHYIFSVIVKAEY